MKKLTGLTACIVLLGMAGLAHAAITWSIYDQFDGATIDASKWIIETEGTGAVLPYLAGGRLVLEAKALSNEADSEIHPKSPSNYTGIMADLHFAKYEPNSPGYFEAAMEMKVDFGNDYAATFEIRSENISTLVGTAFIEYDSDNPHPKLPEQSIIADWGQVHSVGIAIDENNILFFLDGSVAWAYDGGIYNPAFADATIEIITFGGDVTGYVDNVQLATTDPLQFVVDFSANPTGGPAPLTVSFTDKSTGSITSWEWDFGDGSTSTMQNPSHTYIDPGIYTVSLTVNGPGGSDTNTKADYIIVRSPDKAMPWVPLLLTDE